MSQKIQRFSRVVKGFDPNIDGHVLKVEKRVTEKLGEGYRVVDFDPVAEVVTLERGRTVTEVRQTDRPERMDVNLKAGLKPSDGDREASSLQDRYPGFYLTRFEPHLQSAVLEKLDEDLVRARGAFSISLGVKPWEITIAKRTGGGYILGLPNSYMPSKHDEKLDEVATAVVGQMGWYVKADPKHLRAEVIPAQPPTFPGAIPYPLDEKPAHGDNALPLGEILSERAVDPRRPLILDLGENPHSAINGISGAGKAQPLSEVIPVPVSRKFPDGLARIGDLSPGDEALDEDGQETSILDLSPIVVREVFRVTAADGRSTRCSADHLWSIHRPIDPLVLSGDLRRARRLAADAPAHRLVPLSVVAQDVGIAENTLSDALGGLLDPIAPLGLFPYGETILWALRAAQGVEVRVVETRSLRPGDVLPDGTEIADISATGKREEMRCLLVADPRHVYLAADRIPTHNTVTINAVIFGALARGMDLAIIDVPAKKVDFLWAKKFCAPGYWGADSLEASVTTMGLIYDEGQRRAQMLEEHRVVKMTELPPSLRPREIVVVVDELTGLFMPEEVPKLSKDDPIRIEAEQINSNKARLKRYIKKTAAELRFVGIKLVLSTQVASASTGITPDLRTNLANKILLGAKPTDGNRKLALNDPMMVPNIPSNIQNDRKAARGVGVFEFEGAVPGVFKSYYADLSDYESKLSQLGVPTYGSSAPTKRQIAQYVGGGGELPEQLEDGPDPWNGRRVPKSAADKVYSEDGTELKGAAAAARAAKVAGA